jgi:hypothetical protein
VFSVYRPPHLSRRVFKCLMALLTRLKRNSEKILFASITFYLTGNTLQALFSFATSLFIFFWHMWIDFHH